MGVPMRQQPQRPTRLLNSGVGRGLRAAYTPGAAPSRAMPIGAVIVPTVGLGGQPEQAWTNTQKGANGTVFLPTPVVSSAEWTFLALAKCVSSSAVETICDFNDGINQGNRTSLARGAYSSGNIGSDSRPYAPDYNSATLWDNSKPGLLVVTISTAANALKIYYQGALISTTALSSSGIARVAQIQLFSKNTTSYTDPLTIGGTVSLVAFWDRAVTAQEVAALYQNPWQLFDAGSSSSAYQAAIVATAGGSAQLRTVSPSGGIALGGSAPRTRGRAAPTSGGLTLSGATTPARGRSAQPAGGVLVSGLSQQVRSGARSSSGGTLMSGTIQQQRSASRMPQGGAVLSGSTSTRRGSVHVSVGGLSLSGVASALRAVARMTSGGLVLAGRTTVGSSSTSQVIVIPTGLAAKLGGSGAVKRGVVQASSGGMQILGTSQVRRMVARAAAGGVALAGWVQIQRGGRRVAVVQLQIAGQSVVLFGIPAAVRALAPNPKRTYTGRLRVRTYVAQKRMREL